MTTPLYAFAPVAMLLAVALHQRWRVIRYGQSAWKGGGFGMFSDIQTGCITATLKTSSPTGGVAEFSSDLPWGAKVSIIPTEANLRLAAREILQGHWVGRGHRAEPCRESNTDDALLLSGVTVQYARVDFDRRRGAHSAVVQLSVTVAASDD